MENRQYYRQKLRRTGRPEGYDKMQLEKLFFLVSQIVRLNSLQSFNLKKMKKYIFKAADKSKRKDGCKNYNK